MNKEKIQILYISNIPQSSVINWIEHCVTYMNRLHISAKMLNLDRIKLQHPSISTFLNQTAAQEFIYTKFIPFNRFTYIHRLNMKLSYRLYRFQSWVLGKKIVLISSKFDKIFEDVCEELQPDLLIGDACDYLQDTRADVMYRLCQTILTNSIPLQRIHQKNHSNVKLISAGYFLENELLGSVDKFVFEKKAVIFIGTIDWRLDMKFVYEVMEKLPDYKFNFYYTEVNYYSKQNSAYINRKNRESRKLWKEICSLPNFRGTEVKSQEELSKIRVQGSVGMIAYSDVGLFNEYYFFNKYSHPIKFYNYLALGLPTVSKPLESITHFENSSIFFAKDTNSFCKKIIQHSDKRIDEKRRKKLLNIALEQSIEKKTQQIETIILTS